ncbi:hypothetical protein JCM16161A_24320 [Vulcanisaeta sp. JCM 16161]|uniref:hypothetical protein n=1 Tax=Vulcanisaeta sp. JCM 16161 TaxID=1295372 RepID=UPI0006D03409|nr:hypothetical protein [Vulcanisaeta sp. JCM 16161]
MLAYIDYPDWRHTIEDYVTLDELLMRNMKQALSLIVMVGGGYDESINSAFLRVWNGLTGNKGFIEDVHALAVQFRRGLIEEVDLIRALIDLFSRRSFSLADLIMMNNYLKLVNDINVLDLGLVIFYENPESILAGVREPPDLVPNKLVSRELTIDLEARCMVVKRTFSVHLSRQYESGIYVVDWSNPGLIPYSKFAIPRVEGVEVSDPVFSAIVRFGVRAVSRIVGKEFVLTLPKPMDVKTDSDYCVGNVFVSLPQSMGLSDYLSLIGKLMSMGYNVRKSPFTRVDDLIEHCLSSRGQEVK